MGLLVSANLLQASVVCYGWAIWLCFQRLAGYWLCHFSSRSVKLVFVHRLLRVSRRRAKLCKAFRDLDTEPAEYRLCCIFFGNVKHKVSPDSRGGDMPSLNGRAFNIILQRRWVKGREFSHFRRQSSALPNLIISSTAFLEGDLMRPLESWGDHGLQGSSMLEVS